MTPFRLLSRVLPAPRQAAAPTSRISVVQAQVVAPAPVPMPAPRHAPASAFAPLPTPRAAEAQTAVVVPWRVVARSSRGVIEFEQCGVAPLRVVRFVLAGAGLLGLSLPRTVHPGERVRLVLRGRAVEQAHGAPDALLVVRWLEGDGRELLWPVAL